MKKQLLSVMAIAATALVSLADTAVLDLSGTGDVYGLTRQEFPSSIAPANVTDKKCPLVLEQGDAVFTFTRKEGEPYGDDSGYALVAYRPSNPTAITNGLYSTGAMGQTSATYQWPLISVAVPGGKITKVELWANAGVSGNTECTFGSLTAAKGTADSSFGNTLKYTWTGEADGEVTWTPNTALYGSTYFRKISVEYTIEAGSLLPNDLAFSSDEAKIVKRDGNTVDVPVLSNEHDLPLTWVSSNTAVATVDANGKVTPVAPGETRISASFAGNDEYVKGTVSYVLKVVGSANNIKQMFALAPNSGDEVYVNFPMTVCYYNDASGGEYVTDLDGNGALVRGESVTSSGSETSTEPIKYEVGVVIPQGWFVTNTPEGRSTWIKWIGVPEASTETATVTYPAVSNITPEDAYRTLVLKNLTVETPGVDDDPYNGMTADGTSVEIRNSFRVALPAGTWDVTGIVQYSKLTTGSTVYFYFMPISYTEPAALEFPESFNVTADSKDVKVEQEYDGEYYAIAVTGTTTEDTVSLTFDLPEGWDGLIGIEFGRGIMNNGKKRANAAEWATIEEFKAQWSYYGDIIEGKTLTFKADEPFSGFFFLYSGDKVDTANAIQMLVQVEKVEMAELEIPEEFVVKVDAETLDVTQEHEAYDEGGSEHGIYVSGTTTEDNVVITVEVPEGWDGFIGMNDVEMMGGGAEPWRRAKAIELEDMSGMLEFGMKTGNVFTFPADGVQHWGQYYLYKGDEYACADSIYIFVTATKTEKDPTGVEAIEAEDAEVRYFNLQGVELSKPEGVCVKVVKNKASKVVK